MQFWAEDGPHVAALKESPRGGECEYKAFPEMSHGWSVRGDVGDASVKRDVELAMSEAKAFLAKHMA